MRDWNALNKVRSTFGKDFRVWQSWRSRLFRLLSWVNVSGSNVKLEQPSKLRLLNCVRLAMESGS